MAAAEVLGQDGARRRRVHPALLALEHLGPRERLHEQEPHPRSRNPLGELNRPAPCTRFPGSTQQPTYLLRPKSQCPVSKSRTAGMPRGGCASARSPSTGEGIGGRIRRRPDGILSWVREGEGEGGRRGVGKAEATRKRNGNMESLPTKWSFSHLKKKKWSFSDGWFFSPPRIYRLGR